jgi:acetyltransferase-like isoleucine patch superfamily enzyme
MAEEMTRLLNDVERELDGELDTEATSRILEMLGGQPLPDGALAEARLYEEFLPKAATLGVSQRQRHLHLLWDVVDRLPVGVVTSFAIPYRRLIAERLFKRCGRDFIADEGVRFNFGQNLVVGDDVFLNRGVYLDTKGGLTLGDSVALAEWVVVFTHTHSESDHAERTYATVEIRPYAKVYSDAMILPGVTVGEEAIVAARSLVHGDVEPGTLVAGIPAAPVRPRKNEGRHGAELNHTWFGRGAFQEDRHRTPR